VASNNAKSGTRGRVYTVTGTATNYVNLITGLVSYAHKYLYAVNHDIEIQYDDNNVKIIITIKDVTDKIPRFD